MRHELLAIEKENPFKHCKLQREIYAEVLTEVVKTNSQGFVMGLNSKWGTGKTTFVKMWLVYLENLNFKTIYFNAWENDFEDNALTALIGELKPIMKPESTKLFDNILEKGLIISKHILPILIKSLIEKHIDSKSLQDNLKDITEEAKDIFKKEVDEYLHRKENITEFKESLKKFVADTTKDKPLVFVIDELDRCRPNYAVSLLEQIKHFFSVPNIVFVLSIDKKQLEFAIKGVYGNDNIDSEEYLRRFIDLEYSLPNPDPKKFSDYLYNYYNLSELFEEKNRNMIGNEKSEFLKICYYLFSNPKITLRQQEKIFAHATAVFKTCKGQRQIFPVLFITLIYLKVLHSESYNNIKLKIYSIEDLQQSILNIFFLNEKHYLQPLIEANLVFFYNNFLNPNTNNDQLYDFNPVTNTNELKIGAVSDHNQLLRLIIDFENRYFDFQINSIDQIIARIDLVSRE
ncbi:KAP family P-loop domain-containing protein [Flavobacterium anhuiense]|uniref:KAP family P-loop domain-containing protein n=1 Tax=Flavobacterium anhuiense TaxID=459526 RepID=A0ABY0LT07_9FLAO|nr:P-loop NTPase fold protein [Flavobacterium anhuiense]SCY62401.1 KAP family P-loop domain-containing protein [Flavobacterium anhuiense]